MEAFPILTSQTLSPTFPMNTICFNFRTKIRFCSSNYRSFSGSSLIDVHEYVHSGSCRKRVLGDSCRVRAKVSDAELKEKWLNSLSCPLPEKSSDLSIEPRSNGTEMEWVVGIDPDLSGALALLKTDQSGCSAQVFDTPHLQVLVGKRIRRRLDAKSIVQLVRSFDTPPGTTAYIEQSIPYPQDGKQGWWSGGFGYGLWIGILVASGFSVVPVPSLLWKNHFQLAGARLTKDDSRKAASTLFPSLSSQLTRKKDHGRAEALLIAAYGQGLVLKSDDPDMESEELVMESGSFEVIRKDHNIQPECLSLIAEDLYMKSEDLEVKPGHVMKSKRAVRSKDLLVKSEGLS